MCHSKKCDRPNNYKFASEESACARKKYGDGYEFPTEKIKLQKCPP